MRSDQDGLDGGLHRRGGGRRIEVGVDIGNRTEIEDLAPEASHRGFDRDRPHRCQDAALFGAGDFGLDLGEAEGRAFGGERDQSQPAELLRAVSGRL
jgi:hypothetical protein